MAPDRDVAAFDRRAGGYESGWRGRLHYEITRRTLEIALSAYPEPSHVLDVGCGTGHALCELAERAPVATSLIGVDPAPAMVAAARTATTSDDRIEIRLGRAESLPVPARSFDLIIAITSFDHWADQPVGLRQCAAALAAGGVFVLTDLFSLLLAPTMVVGRRGHARTRSAGDAALRRAGLDVQAWHTTGPLLKTVVAACR